MIVTDDGFGNAALISKLARERARGWLRSLPQRRTVPVVTGFRAVTSDGSCTPLGRGGSDCSATILGAALSADEIWIWTHVDGMMTADSRLVPDAQVIPELASRESIELSFFGAKVLHPKSLELPFRAGIPVLIKNGLNPSAAGTEIGRSIPESVGVRAIASTSEAALVTATSDKRVSFTRLAALVFGWVDADRVPTLVVTQCSAENDLYFAVNSVDGARIRRRLERERFPGEGGPSLAKIEELTDLGVVVAVGEGMKGTPGIAARIFGWIARLGIDIAAIAQGSSELGVSLVAKSSGLPAAVRDARGIRALKSRAHDPLVSALLRSKLLDRDPTRRYLICVHQLRRPIGGRL
ncbi:MAG: aspartate kinase [Acidimicrobiales bacterium]